MSVPHVVQEGHFLRVSKHCLTRVEDRGCNPGLVATTDGVVFVDLPQKPSDALRWIEEARAYGPPRVLVNTEHHLDHCAGNGFLDVPIIAHEGTYARFFEASPIWKSSSLDAVAMFRRIDPDLSVDVSDYKVTPPQITFAHSLDLHFGGVRIRAVNLPGHLPNSTVVHVPEEGVVYMSDNLFCLEMPWLHEADPRAWVASLEEVKSWSPDVIVPGHGPVSGIEALDHMREFLVEFIGSIETAISRGQSAQETAREVDFIPRFTVPAHLSALAPKIQEAGILRTYRLLTGD